MVVRNPWFDGKYDEKRLTETQWLHEERQSTGITARPNAEPGDFEILLIERVVYEDGRITGYQRFDSQRGSIASFSWLDGRLERSVTCSASHGIYHPNCSIPEYSEWRGPEEVFFEEYTFDYNEPGELQRIWSKSLNADGTPDEDSRSLKYRRPVKGESIPALSADIESILLDQIPKALKEAKLNTAVYCLLLCYCGEDYQAGWPPFLVLGSEKERQRIVKEGSDIDYYLWAPDEMRDKSDNIELQLQDQALVERCSIHSELMSMKGSFAPAVKVLKNVAHKLNEFRWSGILTTTPDFIVAFVNNTCEALV